MTNKKSPGLSICIVNHNAKQMTLACLKSIYEKTKMISYEIILVDNTSKDGSQEAIRNEYPDVHLICNETNRGFAGANNQAMAIAAGRYIILLNNDTVLLNDALSIMVEFMVDHQDAGLVTCMLYNSDLKTFQRICRMFPTPLGTLFGRTSFLTKIFPNNYWSKNNLLTDWGYDSVKKIDWVPGAAVMVRKEIIDNIGGLDGETFYMYWEDTDWCKRIRDAGWEIYFTPEAKILHYGGQGGTKLNNLLHNIKMMFYMHYSAYKYFRKHYFKNPLHPMAIMTFTGMAILVGGKSVVETIKHFWPKQLKYF